MLKKMPLRQAARVTLVGDIASISAMEIITENSLVLLIPGYSCMQTNGYGIFWLGLGIILPATGYAVSLIQPCTGQ
jgi:hypothetical protein